MQKNYEEELEICVRAKESFNEVYKKMLNLGFHIQEDFILKDIYMVPNDISISLENENLIFSNYILIRETVGKRKVLALKQKKINEKGEIINQKSIKCPIIDIDKTYEFIKALGYKKIFEITDHNILMSNGKNEIYIQDVKGVGTYIEMEQNNLLLKNNNGNNIEEMKNTLNSYNLNIDDNDYFVRKAADVLKSIL